MKKCVPDRCVESSTNLCCGTVAFRAAQATRSVGRRSHERGAMIEGLKRTARAFHGGAASPSALDRGRRERSQYILGDS